MLHIICLSFDVANGSTPVSDLVMGDKVESGVPHIGLVSQQRGFIMHTHHTMHEAVIEPGQGLLTQVPAIIRDPSTLVGVLLHSLNSMF